MAGKTEEALSCLNEVVGVERDEDLLLLRAGLRVKRGMIAEALADADACLKLDPRNLLALRLKAAILEDQLRLEAAIETCDRILALEPQGAGHSSEYWEAWLKKGQLTRNATSDEEAAAVFHELRQANPALRQAWTSEAECLRSMQREESALHLLRTALSLPGAGYDEFHVTARILIDQEKWQEALRYSNAMIEDAQEKGVGWTLKALAMTMLGQGVEALEASKQALLLDPQSADAWAANGSALARVERYEEALESWVRAENLRPGMQALALNRASVLIRLARFNEAVSECDKLMDGKVTVKAEALFYKGYALTGLKRNEEAIEAFSEASRLGWKGADQVLKQLQGEAK